MLKEIAEYVKAELNYQKVSQVDIKGFPELEVSITIPQDVLNQYGLSLNSVAESIRDEVVDIPGGLINHNKVKS